MDTVWKDIAGYEGHYQVSNRGEVRSIKRKPKTLKSDRQRNGYRRVYLWLGNGKKNLLVHRLVAQAFIPNPYDLAEINHLDEDKDNNDAGNLEWCTHHYNMNYGSVRAKISAANTGRTLSDETKRKLSLDTSRRRWISNGETEKYVYVEDVDSWLEAGWHRGRNYRRKDKCTKK